jgi:hypothetical protein
VWYGSDVVVFANLFMVVTTSQCQAAFPALCVPHAMHPPNLVLLVRPTGRGLSGGAGSCAAAVSAGPGRGPGGAGNHHGAAGGSHPAGRPAPRCLLSLRHLCFLRGRLPPRPPAPLQRSSLSSSHYIVATFAGAGGLKAACDPHLRRERPRAVRCGIQPMHFRTNYSVIRYHSLGTLGPDNALSARQLIAVMSRKLGATSAAAAYSLLTWASHGL